ncbi:MAG: helix-turn-helix domain-containing protein [Bacteroidetes bacterium]|nr:helix-turn-helix domain-containing protein [Bacteroidota bacterium]
MPATTLAVLPFVNMSSNSENEYFSDGITEEIINALAKIESLKVTSRTSSFFFKGQSVPLKEVAQALDVSVILEGSVRSAGNTVRITAQLIQAEDDFHFWSESWDRKLENIFEIQDDISLLIAEKLREQYGHFEIAEHLVEKQTESIDAYELSLKAKFHFNKWNPDDAKKSIELWKKALALDPNHIPSLVGIADAYGFLGVTQNMPYDEAWTNTAEFTNKALELDPNNAPAHYQLANISFFVKADFQEAYTQVQRSVELKPNYAEAQQFTAFLHLLVGDKKQAWKHLEVALEIDPLNQETIFYKAYFHHMNSEFETALNILNDCLAKNPQNLPAIITKCYSLLNMKRVDQALAILEQAPEGFIPAGDALGISCLAHIIAKDERQADNYLEELFKQAQSPMAFQEHSYLMQAYAQREDYDKAFDWLEKAISMKSSILFLGFAGPLASNLRKDARYKAFKTKLYGQLPKAKQEKEKNALLDNETASNYSTTLLAFMSEEQPYLTPDLSLRSLADRIEIHPNQLSWLLNDRLGKNFNQFINHYRVEHFKHLAVDQSNAHISLIGLAYESGFNSKTVFNTYFKKEVGMTPKEFLKSSK